MSIGIVGSLNKVNINNPPVARNNTQREVVDVGFTNSLDKEMSETAEGGKGVGHAILPSETDESVQ